MTDDVVEPSMSAKGVPAIDRLAWVVSGLATIYEIEQERAARIASRWAESFRMLRNDDPAASVEAFCHFPLSIAWDIRNVLEGARALSIVEQDDPLQLAQRVQAAAFLLDEATPLHGLAEFADLMQEFISYLERDRDHLLRTGLPQSPFTRSRWLYHQLGRLYDTRLTSAPWPFEELFPRAHVVGEPRPAAYEWIRVVEYRTETRPAQVRAQLRRLLEQTGRALPSPSADAELVPAPSTRDEDPIVRCHHRFERCSCYEEASLLEFLDPSAAARLEALRPTFFELKIAILARIRRALLARSPARLWEDCTRLVDERFDAGDAGFLLKMDYIYMNANFLDPDSVNPKMIPGGLSNLLEVIGHVEKELRAGPIATARESFDQLVDPGDWDKFKSNLGAWGDKYYNIINRIDKVSVDSVLDDFMAHTRQADALCQDFRNRVEQFLDEGLREPCAIIIRLPKKIKESVIDNITDYVYKAVLRYKQDGVLPFLEFRAANAGSEYKFQKTGGGWSLQFQDESDEIRDLLGMQYIHYLLSNANKPIDVSRLYMDVNGPGFSSQRAEGAKAVQEELFEIRSRDEVEEMDEKGAVRADDVHDSEGIKYFRNQRRQIKTQISALEERLGELQSSGKAAGAGVREVKEDLRLLTAARK